MKVAISSGHGKYVRGAEGFLDEVDEARRVVERVAGLFVDDDNNDVIVFTDLTSHSQDENLETIVAFHNNQVRDLDVSIHFNAFEQTEGPMGVEVLYVTQSALAAEMSAAIAKAGGFIDRGAKKRTDLYFLNNTEAPAILIEVCFVDSEADARAYTANFDEVCGAIAEVIGDVDGEADIPRQRDIVATVFGGADDYNVSAYDEHKVLNDKDLYVALPDRFDGERPKVRVTNRANSKSAVAEIWDVGPWNIADPYWTVGARPMAETCYDNGTPLPSGPNAGRVPSNGAGIDLSPALANAIGIEGKGYVHWELI
jgi:N-acetylmuramoyl-L-alanine amidase